MTKFYRHIGCIAKVVTLLILMSVQQPLAVLGTNQTTAIISVTEQDEPMGAFALAQPQSGAPVEAMRLSAEPLARKKPIKLVINDQEISLTDPIRNIDGRTYYPFRSCLESMGAQVEWQQSSQTATGTLGVNTVTFAVGEQKYAVNGQGMNMADAVTYLDPVINRVYIPIRYAAEALDFAVTWVEADQFDTVILTTNQPINNEIQTNAVRLNGHNVVLGQTTQQLINELGKPNRIDQSAYGWNWYIYNRQYENFIMVGVQSDKVVSFFTNARDFKLMSDLGPGASQSAVRSAYEQISTMSFWFDPNNQQKLYAVWCYEAMPNDYEIESNFFNKQDILLRTYEQECLDITNAFRLANNQPIVTYSGDAARIAYGHAKDMAERDFFDHVNPDGQGPLQRMVAGGMDVQKVTENCAGGYVNAIEALKGWVESPSHRLGMLEPNKHLGVGAYYKKDSKYLYYLVQNFITPW
jgi:uncharacterized protein YkwD